MALMEVDGIQLDVDARIFNDMRFVRLYGKLNDPEQTPIEAARNLDKVLDVVFGKDSDRILDELAKRNDGYVGPDELGDFLKRIGEKLSDLKEQSSSPAS